MDSDFKGKCIIFSAPSGAGKTSIVRNLLKQNLPLMFSISACSRAPRDGEKNGIDYHFLGLSGFKHQIEEDAFVEWEEVYPDNFYGTLRSEIERIWADGKHVLFDVDVIGGLSLKKQFKHRALAIFVDPPSIEVLEERLRNRQTETDDKVQMRMKKAAQEMETASQFDIRILNDDFDLACKNALEKVKSFLSVN